MQTNLPVWDETAHDPRNKLGYHVVWGRDSVYRNRMIEYGRVESRPMCLILTQAKEPELCTYKAA